MPHPGPRAGCTALFVMAPLICILPVQYRLTVTTGAKPWAMLPSLPCDLMEKEGSASPGKGPVVSISPGVSGRHQAVADSRLSHHSALPVRQASD